MRACIMKGGEGQGGQGCALYGTEDAKAWTHSTTGAGVRCEERVPWCVRACAVLRQSKSRCRPTDSQAIATGAL